MRLDGDRPGGAPLRRVYRVSEINAAASRLLEETYGFVLVDGEISDFKRHGQSGHCYFSLKDEGAELRCVLFRTAAARLKFAPADGVRVVASGRLTIYAARGQYQLVVEEMVVSGEGELQRRFEALRARLQAEGLFAEERKRRLPRFPRVVGVVTSPSGAAVRDIVRVLRARWPGAAILLSAVRVQGEGAADDIARGIARQGGWGRADVLIVGRGGGSLEDLWAFNEEAVVRAIVASPIPVISAVGHESDVTLSDFAADVRASTPSRAAELAVPDRREVQARLAVLARRLHLATREGLRARGELLRRVGGSHGLHRPRMVVENAAQRIDEIARRLELAGRHGLRDRRGLLAALAGRLRALDPSSVLGRGYALCATEDGGLVRDGGRLRRGDRLRLRFERGGAAATVDDAWAGGPGPREES
jgi:exodeoxyribonuclease VII large subunit